MCWITYIKKYTVKKTAKEDLNVFKVVLIKKDGIFSIFQDFHYDIGTTYTRPGKFEITTSQLPLCIYEGFHSYSMYCKIYHNKKNGILLVSGITNKLLHQGYNDFNSVILHCAIPKGAEYYENEDGEIVSNQLTVKSVEC